MKKQYLIITIFILFTSTGVNFAQSIPGLTFGGNGNDVGLSICRAHGGGYAIAGSTRSFGAGSNDFYFLVLDTGGQIIVNKTYGWQHHDFFRSIIPVSTGYVFVGDAWDYGPGGLDIYLLSTDNSGCCEQGYFYGTPKRDNGFDVLQTDDNGFLILGHSRLHNPKGDIYLLKVNAEGEKQWEKSFWDTGNDYAFQIIKSNNNDGYVFVGSKDGFFDDVHADFQTHDADILLIKVDNNGNQIWKKTYGKTQHDFGYSLCNAASGGYYVLGSSQSYGNGSFDMLLIKTDEAGNEQWHKTFGGTDFEYGKSLVQNDDGDLYLLGSSKSFGTQGSVDVYIVKTDETGNELWSITVGGNDNDFGEDIIAEPNGGCALTGYTKSFGQGGTDAYFLRLTADGKVNIFTDVSPKHYKKLVFYPNPMNCSGTFEIPDFSHTGYTIRLFDTFGRTVMEKGGGNKIIIHKGNLASGTYLYKIIADDNAKQSYSGKLIIK